MKTGYFNQKKILALIAIFSTLILATSFQDSGKLNTPLQQIKMDTVPNNHDVEIDIQMKELDKAMINLDKNLKDINWNKISKEIELSLKNIDIEKIKMDVASSLKSVDWDKIKTDVNNSLKQIDMEKINLDIKKAMDDVKVDLNTVEFKKSIEEIKKIDMNKIHEELKKAGINIEKNKVEMKREMSKAKKEIIRAKGELSEIKVMINEMEKDGLLSKKDGYTVEYKNKRLQINGKEQSAEVTEKYRKYFKGDSFKIQRSKED